MNHVSKVRSLYNGLAINKLKGGSKSSQIWLLGENDDNVLRGQAISNFRWREDNTGDYFPREVNMMFVSMPRLAGEQGLCGNLARHILDGKVDELDEELKAIAEMFRREFESFKSEEEVIRAMTILDETRAEAWEEGREEGREEGISIGEAKAAAAYTARVEGMLIDKIQKRESVYDVKKLALDFGITDERLTELLSGSAAVQNR